LDDACDESDIGVRLEGSTGFNDEIDKLLLLLVELDVEVEVEEEPELDDDAASACNSGSEAAAFVLLEPPVLPEPLLPSLDPLALAT
jgi:hypothetical protein